MNILYSASGVLSIFFIALLLGKKEQSRADRILAIWFGIIFLGIVSIYLNYNEVPVWQGFFEFADASVFLHGPIIWLYTQALTRKHFHWRGAVWWHFLPFFLCLAYLGYPLMAGEEVSEVQRNVVLVLKMSHLLVYALLVLYRLYLHGRTIAHYFSYTEKVELNWLQLVVMSMLVVWVIGTVSQALYEFGQIDIPQNGGFFTNVAVCLFVLVIGYFGIRQTHVFSPALPPESTKRQNGKHKAVSKVKGKNRPHTGLSADFERLQNHMEGEKPYLEGKLTLYDLAVQLELSPHVLSKVINKEGGKSFFDFINTYRVEPVKRQLRAGAHRRQTLLAIALDSGFNSKASFNRVFKKMTGLTPREFVQRLDMD